MNRAVLWLVGGIGLLALAILAIAPELLADLGTAGSAIGIALAALVPATIVAVLFVATRRRNARPRGAHAGTAPGHDPAPRGHDPAPRGHDPAPRGHDPAPRGHDPRPGA